MDRITREALESGYLYRRNVQQCKPIDACVDVAEFLGLNVGQCAAHLIAHLELSDVDSHRLSLIAAS